MARRAWAPLTGSGPSTSTRPDGTPAATASALDATRRNAFDEVPLEEDVEHENRDRREDDRRHQRRPVVRVAAGCPEEPEPQRQRPVRPVPEQEQGPEEAVP